MIEPKNTRGFRANFASRAGKGRYHSGGMNHARRPTASSNLREIKSEWRRAPIDRGPGYFHLRKKPGMLESAGQHTPLAEEDSELPGPKRSDGSVVSSCNLSETNAERVESPKAETASIPSLSDTVCIFEEELPARIKKSIVWLGMPVVIQVAVITKFVSPNDFIISEKSVGRDKLYDRLQKRIIKHYSVERRSDLTLSRAQIVPGKYCVVSYNSSLYRALIVEAFFEKETATVLLVDSGLEVVVSNRDLLSIDEQFLLAPQRCASARIRCLLPTVNESNYFHTVEEFSPAVLSRFKQMGLAKDMQKSRVLTALIVGYDSEMKKVVVDFPIELQDRTTKQKQMKLMSMILIDEGATDYRTEYEGEAKLLLTKEIERRRQQDVNGGLFGSRRDLGGCHTSANNALERLQEIKNYVEPYWRKKIELLEECFYRFRKETLAGIIFDELDECCIEIQKPGATNVTTSSGSGLPCLEMGMSKVTQ